MDKPIKILFLAANPKDTSPLRLDEEIRGIDQALRQAEFRDRFDIKQHWAVRVTDLQSYFLRYEPDIVHFSGHGSELSEIILEDNDGNSQPVSNRALTQLFSVLKDNIRCVVLNACYSEQQAQAIAKNIDCVIGMSKAVGDSTAISFAVAFYQALGFGRDVKTAFDLGCLQIDLESLGEQDTPKLLAINSDPQEIVFVKAPLAPPNLKTGGIKEVNKRFIQNRKLKKVIWVSIPLFLTVVFYFIFIYSSVEKPSANPPANPKSEETTNGGPTRVVPIHPIFTKESEKAKAATPENEDEIPPDPPEIIISQAQVEQMIKSRKFYDYIINPKGQGSSHKYRTEVIQGYKVVIDETTQLMWQHSGSPTSMSYIETKDYIKKLKRDKKGGYNDWRLPRLEEAVALVESEKKNGDLNINSEFDRLQKYIWTSSKESETIAWAVSFSEGWCGAFSVDNIYRFVRAVRSPSNSIDKNK